MTRDELARRVAERALLHGDFVLRSGRRSSVYLDKYRFETDPALLGPIGAELAALATANEPAPDRLAGPELGAVPLAAATALSTGIPFLIVRKAAKDYATEGLIEGVFEAGERVLVIEDVVTTGGALIAAVGALRQPGWPWSVRSACSTARRAAPRGLRRSACSSIRSSAERIWESRPAERLGRLIEPSRLARRRESAANGRVLLCETVCASSSVNDPEVRLVTRWPRNRMDMRFRVRWLC